MLLNQQLSLGFLDLNLKYCCLLGLLQYQNLCSYKKMEEPSIILYLKIQIHLESLVNLNIANQTIVIVVELAEGRYEDGFDETVAMAINLKNF